MKRETNVGRCRMKDVKDAMIYGDTMTLVDFAFGQHLKARDRDFLWPAELKPSQPIHTWWSWYENMIIIMWRYDVDIGLMSAVRWKMSRMRCHQENQLPMRCQPQASVYQNSKARGLSGCLDPGGGGVCGGGDIDWVGSQGCLRSNIPFLGWVRDQWSGAAATASTYNLYNRLVQPPHTSVTNDREHEQCVSAWGKQATSNTSPLSLP